MSISKKLGDFFGDTMEAAFETLPNRRRIVREVEALFVLAERIDLPK